MTEIVDVTAPLYDATPVRIVGVTMPLYDAPPVAIVGVTVTVPPVSVGAIDQAPWTDAEGMTVGLTE